MTSAVGGDLPVHEWASSPEDRCNRVLSLKVEPHLTDEGRPT